jgi:1-acyl-sn-glycerol-3-phosphate acyltransferase
LHEAVAGDSVREYLVFFLLLLIKSFSRLFYRIDVRWLGAVPARPWRDHRLVALLNHTSLYEALFTGAPPAHFLFRIARHGVVPIAQKTAQRAVVGRFYKLVAQHVISITRERDETWKEVLRKIDPDAMVIILPEGRMKRANGLDSQGKPMTMRGGIADILESLGEGRMLVAYSGGLHHVQAPGERWPRLFKTIRLRLEVLDIGRYRAEMMAQCGGPRGFKRAVADDLERRRDLYCPITPETDSPEAPPERRLGKAKAV